MSSLRAYKLAPILKCCPVTLGKFLRGDVSLTVAQARRIWNALVEIDATDKWQPELSPVAREHLLCRLLGIDDSPDGEEDGDE